MNPRQAIERLHGSGMTEAVIAAAVNSTQPTINRIHRGESSPKYELGRALVEMAAALDITERTDAV